MVGWPPLHTIIKASSSLLLWLVLCGRFFSCALDCTRDLISVVLLAGTMHWCCWERRVNPVSRECQLTTVRTDHQHCPSQHHSCSSPLWTRQDRKLAFLKPGLTGSEGIIPRRLFVFQWTLPLINTSFLTVPLFCLDPLHPGTLRLQRVYGVLDSTSHSSQTTDRSESYFGRRRCRMGLRGCLRHSFPMRSTRTMDHWSREQVFKLGRNPSQSHPLERLNNLPSSSPGPPLKRSASSSNSWFVLLPSPSSGTSKRHSNPKPPSPAHFPCDCYS